MNATIAIAAREIRERYRLFIVAAALAFVPFVIGFVRDLNGQREIVIATSAGFLALAYAGALAVAQGTSTIGRDLTEKRLSFYFTKPISTAAIWSGKAAAAIVTCIAALLIVVVPSFVATGEHWWSVWKIDISDMLVLIAIPCIALFFVSHAISTMFRSRSMLIALDFIFAVGTVMVLMLLVRPLTDSGAFRVSAGVLSGSIAAILVVLAVAPFRQLARGRTDARRSHIALSSVLWPAVGVVLLVASAYVLWFMSPSVTSLIAYKSFHQASNGEWFVIGGFARGRGEYLVGYAVHTPTGKTERISSFTWWGDGFSRDGSTYAWIQPRRVSLFSRDLVFDVRARRFEGATSREIDTRIVETHPRTFVLSDDGRRIATAVAGRINVYEVDGGRLLAAAQFNEEALGGMFFPSPGVVRIHARRGATLQIHELDIDRRRLTQTGEVPMQDFVRPSEDGSRMYLRSQATIADGRTGAPIAKLPVERAEPASAAMLRDGSVVVAHRRNGVLLLSWFDRDGALRREFPLPLKDAIIGVQVGDAHVMVVQQGNRSVEDRKIMLVSLAGDAPPQPIPGLRGPGWVSDVDPRLPFYEYGATLAAFGRGKLVRWNPQSGSQPLFQ